MDSELELEEKRKITSIIVNSNEKEDAAAEVPAHREESASRKITKDLFVEDSATCEPQDSSGLRNITTSKDLDVKINKPLSHDLKINSSDSEGSLSLNFDTLKMETTSPAQGEDKEDVLYKESMQLLQELNKEREKARQQNRELQMKLAEYFCKRGRDDLELERGRPESEQLQEYEKYIQILSDLKQQLRAASESVQEQAEELRLQAQEKLDEVEKEWREFVALKQDAAVTALSRRLGREAARAKVQSVLTAEELRQDQLTKVRLKHFRLRFRIRRLEAELHEGGDHGRDPLQIQFERLQADRLEQKKQAEKQSEESVKLQKKISTSLELLSNVKEKLCWSQMEVQAKRQQLAEVEALVARKKELLTQTKHARNNLQRDNLRLRERRGLLENRLLLRDFEDVVDASDHLEKHLENLKFQRAEIVFRCGRRRKNLCCLSKLHVE